MYRGSVGAQKNFIRLALYIAMFPQLIAGPIVRYADIEAQLGARSHTLAGAAVGVRRFILGLSKKVLLANLLGELVVAFKASGEKSVLYVWLYAVAYALQVYFDFSGYSDMAIGLGRIFGFRFAENFDHPYVSGSVTEFWRRWHISLGTWFRDYLYIPLGGNRVSRPRWLLNLLIVWMATGLWHGAAWNFVVWGLWFAALLILEKSCGCCRGWSGVSRSAGIFTRCFRRARLRDLRCFQPRRRGLDAGVHVRRRGPAGRYGREPLRAAEQFRFARGGGGRRHAGPAAHRGSGAAQPVRKACAADRGAGRFARAACRVHGVSGRRFVQPVPVFSVLRGRSMAEKD